MKNKKPLGVVCILTLAVLLFAFTDCYAQYDIPALDISSPANFVLSLPVSSPWLVGPLANSSILAPPAILWGYSYVPTSPWYREAAGGPNGLFLPTLDISSPSSFVSSLPVSPPWFIGPLADSSIFAPQAILWGYSYVPTSPWY